MNIKNIVYSKVFKIISLSTIGLVLFYTALGFLILPAVLLDQAPKIVKEQLNRELQIEDVTFNPFSLEFTVKGLAIKNLDTSDFVKFDRFYINVGVIQSIKDLTLTIDEVLLEQPYALIQRNKNGLFNFTDLAGDKPPEAEKSPSDEIFPLNITKIKIVEGQLNWEDHFSSQFQREEITPVNLEIDHFTTIINEHSQLAISLKLASGGTLDWQGKIELTPFQSSGRVKLNKVNFHQVWKLFLQDSVNFKIDRGSELIEMDYQLSETEKGMQFLLSNAHIDLYDLQLSAKNNQIPLIKIPDFKVSGISLNLLEKKIEISKVSANNAYFKTGLNKAGELNYQALFASHSSPQTTESESEKTESSDPEQAWSIHVKQLALNDFSVDFTDDSLKKPVQTTINAVSFNTTELTSPLENSAYSGWGIQLFGTPKGMQFLLANADIDLQQLQLSEKNSPVALVKIPDFKVSGISVDLLEKQVAITSVSAHKAYFKAWLNKAGTINYQTLFTADSASQNKPVEPAKAESSEQDQAWRVGLKQLALNDFSLDFTDHSLKKPAKIKITALTLKSSEISSDLTQPLPFDLGLNFNGKGRLKIKGKAVIEPFSSQLNLDIGKIALKDFQPYINQYARLDIISGLFYLKADIKMKQAKNAEFAMTFKGDSRIDALVTRDQKSHKDVVNWKQLKLNKIDLDLAANQYNIASVILKKPYARVLIRKDKSMNFDDLVIEQKANKKPIAKKSVKKKQPKISFKVASFKIIEGVSDFSDKSLILPFSAHINHLNGRVKGISSRQNSLVKIDLNGRVANLSPVIIKGTVSPYKGNSDFSLEFKSMPLPLMTPYMAEFAGRKIEKGNMTLGLKYKIQDNKLTASNNLLIDQLVLGDEVENPEAVSIPLGLAIALLQDSDGKITLDVPITGDLDNPEFSVASIVMDALVNVLTKIIASPFNAIASLIGSDEDISQINFLAGNAVLDEQQQDKLKSLVGALSKRPDLKLEIKGAAYSKQDWPLLQDEALGKQLLQIWSAQLKKEGIKQVLPSHLNHTDEKYQELLADLFIQKFPELGERSIFGKPRLLNPELGDFYKIAHTKLTEIIPPDTQRLHQLAVTRAQAIAGFLLEKGVGLERVFLLDVDVDVDLNSEQQAMMASTLSLTVD